MQHRLLAVLFLILAVGCTDTNSLSADVEPPPAKATAATITVAANGQIMLDGDPVEFEHLPTALAATAPLEQVRLRVRVEADAHMEMVQHVQQAVRGAGVLQIAYEDAAHR